MLHVNTAEREMEMVSDAGFAIYETLKETLELENTGNIVAIHPASGVYVVAKTRLEAVRRLKSQQPVGPMFVTRIGPSTSSDLSVIDRMSSGLKGFSATIGLWCHSRSLGNRESEQ